MFEIKTQASNFLHPRATGRQSDRSGEKFYSKSLALVQQPKWVTGAKVEDDKSVTGAKVEDDKSVLGSLLSLSLPFHTRSQTRAGRPPQPRVPCNKRSGP